MIEVVAAVIRDGDGRILTVRKQGTDAFMLPGGKREPGEDDLTALARELAEEISCQLITAQALGVYDADAANEPGHSVRGAIYLVETDGAAQRAAEIAELLWMDPACPPPVRLAPLLETWVLPALTAQASETK